MDILQQDRREAAEQRQELCDIISRIQGELQSTEEYRDKVNSFHHLKHCFQNVKFAAKTNDSTVKVTFQPLNRGCNGELCL